MAEETVDTALAVGKQHGLHLNPLRKKSVTEHIPITGAEGYHKAFFSQLAQSCVIVTKGPDGRARPTKLDPDCETPGAQLWVQGTARGQHCKGKAMLTSPTCALPDL